MLTINNAITTKHRHFLFLITPPEARYNYKLCWEKCCSCMKGCRTSSLHTDMLTLQRARDPHNFICNPPHTECPKKNYTQCWLRVIFLWHPGISQCEKVERFLLLRKTLIHTNTNNSKEYFNETNIVKCKAGALKQLRCRLNHVEFNKTIRKLLWY